MIDVTVSIPGRPKPHIQHGLLLEDPHSLFKTNGRGDEPSDTRMAAVRQGRRGFVAMVHATFDSLRCFRNRFCSHAAELQGRAELIPIFSRSCRSAKC